VRRAEADGRLKPGSTLATASSGNTGLSLAMVAAALGYPLIVVMPESAPLDRRRLLLRFGVDVRLTPAGEAMEGAFKRLKSLLEGDATLVELDPFHDPAAVRAHREATAIEILEATEGRLDAFVAGVGTGATLAGVGAALKERVPGVRIVAVEPASSPVLSRGIAGPHGIPGIGPDFVPPHLRRELVDEIVSVTDREALDTSGRLAQEEGLLVGVSSGANVAAALRVAAGLGQGKRVVTILPDTGERYLSFLA
jgi:cysteine synthase A